MVRAEQPLVDVRTALGELRDHVLVHLLHVFDVVHSARYAGLIGDHGNGQPGPVQCGDRLNSALKKLDTLDGADITAIDNDRTVSVEKNPLPTA
jgi:hypothetical protein